jgi:hypothetical protein
MNKSTKIALAAAIIGAPLMMNPNTAIAQNKNEAGTTKSSAARSLYLKIEIKGKCVAVGSENGNVIFKNTSGEYFTIDPKTGDMKTMASDYFIKISNSSTSKSSHYIKYSGKDQVTLDGVDSKGHIIQVNSKGEKFYLDAKTGDMIFVK